MRRHIILLGAVIVGAAALSGIAQPAGGTIQDVLQAAFSNEIIAHQRYTEFAAKADEEGYKGVASFFRAAAKAERVHADRFAGALKKKGVDASTPAYQADVKSTRENLIASIDAEREERDVVYRDSIERAKTLEEKEVAALFDLARTAETEHANLCAIVNASMDDQKHPKTYRVCSHCGYTTDIGLAKCPSCMSAKSQMVSVK